MPRNSNEYSFHLLRLLGLGHTFLKREGKANDLCNVCGLDVNFEGIIQSSKENVFKTILEKAKEDTKRKTSSADTLIQELSQNSKNAPERPPPNSSSSWKTILNEIKETEKQARYLHNQQQRQNQLPYNKAGSASNDCNDSNSKSQQQQQSKSLSSDLISVDNQKFLSGIKCPTLILHSPVDGVIEYSRHATYANQHLPNSTLEVTLN